MNFTVWRVIDLKVKRKGKWCELRLSDLIENFIKEMLEDDDEAIIQRNDLAGKFNCVPSQINYVIATRFTPTQGYYVESQRGGGGYIKIEKVNITKSNYLMHIINSIGDKITPKEVDIFEYEKLDTLHVVMPALSVERVKEILAKGYKDPLAK